MSTTQQDTLKAAVRMMASNHDWGICLQTEADIQQAEQAGLESLKKNSFACAYDDARKHALRLSQGKTNAVLFDRRKHH